MADRREYFKKWRTEHKEQIKEYLAQQNVSFYSANKHLGSMFSKVSKITLNMNPIQLL